jgi:hypothetical protein
VRLVLALAGLAVAAPARAERDASASAGLGAGAIADRAVAALDLGVDTAGHRWALGLGARLRFAEGGLRAADWDEASEVARVVRYALGALDLGAVELSLAAGELGAVGFGRGLAVAGYGAGVDADHGHVGAWARAAGAGLVIDAVVDDVVAPRLAFARVARDGGLVELGGTLALDRALPEAAMLGGPRGDGSLALLAADAAAVADQGGVRIGGFAEAALLAGPALGVGLSVGGLGRVAVGDGDLAARAGLLVASAHFVPGWFGPLYEIERRSVTGPRTLGPLGQVARDGGLGGVAALGEVAVTAPTYGSLAVSVLGRPALADVVAARAALPSFHAAQAALTAAAALDGDRLDAAALAAELRVRLPARLYGTAEVSRLYYEAPATGELAAAYGAMLSVGAVVGEPAASVAD